MENMHKHYHHPGRVKCTTTDILYVISHYLDV